MYMIFTILYYRAIVFPKGTLIIFNLQNQYMRACIDDNKDSFMDIVQYNVGKQIEKKDLNVFFVCSSQSGLKESKEIYFYWGHFLN